MIQNLSFFPSLTKKIKLFLTVFNLKNAYLSMSIIVDLHNNFNLDKV